MPIEHLNNYRNEVVILINSLEAGFASNNLVLSQFASDLADLEDIVASLPVDANLEAIQDDLDALTLVVAGNSTDIVGLDGRVTTLEGDVSTLQTQVATNTGNISTLQTDVSDLQTSVAANTATNNTQQAQIDQLRTDVDSNDVDIAGLRTDTDANTAAIAANTLDIADNASDIADLDTRVTQNETDISALQAATSTNAANITTNATNIATNAGNIQTNSDNIDDLIADVAAIEAVVAPPVNIRTTGTADQTVTPGTLTILDYDTTEYTTGTEDFTVSADGRITVLNSGVYTITAGVVVGAALGLLNSYNFSIAVNADIVATVGSQADLALGETVGLTTATTITLTAGDVVDARLLVGRPLLGIGNALIALLPFLFGAEAQQVNHLSITKVG